MALEDLLLRLDALAGGRQSGIRIEDTVLVTRTGAKILATFPKKLDG